MEQCLALEDYTGGEGEISFLKGEMIQVTAKGKDSGWWAGTCRGKTGLFPNCLVESEQVKNSPPFCDYAVSLYDYCNDADPTEMKFKRGDLIKAHGQCEESPGWWWGVNETQGQSDIRMFPSNFVTCNIVRSNFPFTARGPHELSVKKGDVITVKRKWNDGWWEGECGRRQGIFPANYTSSNTTTLSPPLFCKVDNQVLKVGATECHTCAVNEEITSTMLSSLEQWYRDGSPSSPLDLFEAIPLTPSEGQGSLLRPADMQQSFRQQGLKQPVRLS
eukprot:TRINITY_DN12188_c0_g1_i1.p1 TRINITY_DN12188_c0_g1~~TRINITY_DN12188_c0_g1_i1.p1  ORF type:complete len:275 (+),score=52.53 TRINITY_DN12188_c0_g1_i1:47-871(+)